MEESIILIVDDQPDNTDTMIEYLEESGEKYKFLQALNGEVACKVAEKRLPDLILMDWEMPVMNGYDALLCLKSKLETKDIPVVMATGRSSGADLGKALEAGAADYIRKPIERQELLARVNSCLNISRFIKEIRLKNEELKAYDQMVSHDLKGPIGQVHSFADLLHQRFALELGEEGKMMTETILNRSKASLELIEGILAYASAEKHETMEDKVDLNKILDDVKGGNALRIEQSNAKINLEKLPIVDKGIPVKIYQLFYNLVSNAIKFQKEDTVPEISIYQNGGGEIVVEDNGIGFEQSKADDIFKPLQRLDNSYEGHGIGLGTCKRIVDLHNWKIRAESQPGVGSKFIITI